MARSYPVTQYTSQTVFMVHETPELFKRIVSPYIDAFPLSRTQWYAVQILISISKDGRIIYLRVDDILAGKSEAEKVFFKDSGEPRLLFGGMRV